MTRPAKESLMRELVNSIKSFQDAVDLFDAAAAHFLGVNETDLRCLTLLHDRGPLLPNEIARNLGLTKGATTTALDRLVKAGYIQRVPNPLDGRSVSVHLTDSASRDLDALWAPMRRRGQTVMRSFSNEQLAMMLDFFAQAINLQGECLKDLENLPRR